MLDRLARVLGNDRDGEEWLRDVVEARWRVASLRDLDRVQRVVAFQKTAGVVLALEEIGVPAELADGWLMYRDGSLERSDGYEGARGRVAAVFARYFDGVAVDGPPWRVTDGEEGRPSYDEYAASADFV